MFSIRWPLRRLYKTVLKRLIGRFLKNDLDLPQLDVQLTNGTVELKDLEFQESVFHEALHGTPFRVKRASARRVLAEVPWKEWVSRGVKLDVYDLRIDIVPSQEADSKLDETEGFHGVQLSDSIIDETPAFESSLPKDANLDERHGRKMEGVQALARLVEKIVGNSKLGIHGLIVCLNSGDLSLVLEFRQISFCGADVSGMSKDWRTLSVKAFKVSLENAGRSRMILTSCQEDAHSNMHYALVVKWHHTADESLQVEAAVEGMHARLCPLHVRSLCDLSTRFLEVSSHDSMASESTSHPKEGSLLENVLQQSMYDISQEMRSVCGGEGEEEDASEEGADEIQSASVALSVLILQPEAAAHDLAQSMYRHKQRFSLSVSATHADLALAVDSLSDSLPSFAVSCGGGQVSGAVDVFPALASDHMVLWCDQLVLHVAPRDSLQATIRRFAVTHHVYLHGAHGAFGTLDAGAGEWCGRQCCCAASLAPYVRAFNRNIVLSFHSRLPHPDLTIKSSVPKAPGAAWLPKIQSAPLHVTASAALVQRIRSLMHDCLAPPSRATSPPQHVRPASQTHPHSNHPPDDSNEWWDLVTHALQSRPSSQEKAARVCVQWSLPELRLVWVSSPHVASPPSPSSLDAVMVQVRELDLHIDIAARAGATCVRTNLSSRALILSLLPSASLSAPHDAATVHAAVEVLRAESAVDRVTFRALVGASPPASACKPSRARSNGATDQDHQPSTAALISGPVVQVHVPQCGVRASRVHYAALLRLLSVLEDASPDTCAAQLPPNASPCCAAVRVDQADMLIWDDNVGDGACCHDARMAVSGYAYRLHVRAMQYGLSSSSSWLLTLGSISVLGTAPPRSTCAPEAGAAAPACGELPLLVPVPWAPPPPSAASLNTAAAERAWLNPDAAIPMLVCARRPAQAAVSVTLTGMCVAGNADPSWLADLRRFALADVASDAAPTAATDSDDGSIDVSPSPNSAASPDASSSRAVADGEAEGSEVTFVDCCIELMAQPAPGMPAADGDAWHALLCLRKLHLCMSSSVRCRVHVHDAAVFVSQRAAEQVVALRSSRPAPRDTLQLYEFLDARAFVPTVALEGVRVLWGSGGGNNSKIAVDAELVDVSVCSDSWRVLVTALQHLAARFPLSTDSHLPPAPLPLPQPAPPSFKPKSLLHHIDENAFATPSRAAAAPSAEQDKPQHVHAHHGQHQRPLSDAVAFQMYADYCASPLDAHAPLYPHLHPNYAPHHPTTTPSAHPVPCAMSHSATSEESDWVDNVSSSGDSNADLCCSDQHAGYTPDVYAAALPGAAEEHARWLQGVDLLDDFLSTRSTSRPDMLRPRNAMCPPVESSLTCSVRVVRCRLYGGHDWPQQDHQRPGPATGPSMPSPMPGLSAPHHPVSQSALRVHTPVSSPPATSAVHVRRPSAPASALSGAAARGRGSQSMGLEVRTWSASLPVPISRRGSRGHSLHEDFGARPAALVSTSAPARLAVFSPRARPPPSLTTQTSSHSTSPAALAVPSPPPPHPINTKSEPTQSHSPPPLPRLPVMQPQYVSFARTQPPSPLRTSSPALARRTSQVVDVQLTRLAYSCDSFSPRNSYVSAHTLHIGVVSAVYDSDASPHTALITPLVDQHCGTAAGGRVVQLQVDTVLPDPADPSPSSQEHRLQVRVLPLHINIDTTAIDFLARFFCPAPASASPGPTEGLPDTPARTPPFFQRCTVQPMRLSVSYVRHSVDWGALLSASTMTTLLNLVPLDTVHLDLKRLDLTGVRGWEEVVQQVVKGWVADIRRTQMHKCLYAVEPLSSILSFMSTVTTLLRPIPRPHQHAPRLLQGIQTAARNLATPLAALARLLSTAVPPSSERLSEDASPHVRRRSHSSYAQSSHHPP